MAALYGITLFIISLLVGCGNTQPASYSLEGLDKLTEQEQLLIEDSINQLNDRVGYALIKTSGEGYPIDIQISDIEDKAVLGHALTATSKCKVEIRPSIVNNEEKELLTSVVWHEIAHCLGLSHVEEESDIMFRMSFPISDYESTSIDAFIGRLMNSVAIH